MNPFGLLIGLIVIFLGVIFLGINIGVLPEVIWNQIWQLWPVLLIILGLRLLIRNNVVVLILSLIVLGLAATYVVAFDTLWPAANQPTWVQEWRGVVSSETSTLQTEEAANNSNTLALDLGGLYNLKIEGSTEAQTVKLDLTGPKEVIDELRFTKSGNTLTLKDSDSRPSGRFFRIVNQEVEGTIIVPQAIALDLELSGITKLSISEYQGDTNIDMSGASNVTFSEATAIDPNITMSGAGKVSFDNCRGTGEFDISGASNLVSESCLLDSLRVKASGASKVDIKDGTIGDIDLNLSGASNVTVPKPTGDIQQDTSGTAKVRYND